jgi:nucleotide-binding universal stress UspA family protein
MNAKKIVFPTDFSHCSDAALEYATSLARESNGVLLIVHAEEPTVAYGGGEMYYGILEPDYHELQRMLHEIKPTDPNVAFEHRLLRGGTSPASKIVRFAKEENADLIVMGTHGRTGIGRVFLGSVAEAVVRRALCPVLIMKQAVRSSQRRDVLPARVVVS